MGLSSVVYPGAQHTRFQHSLGAFHLMSEAIAQLRSKGNEITQEESDGVLAAILLHDIGHGPFSHDAIVGSRCIIGNSTKMAGEIIIDDNAIVSAAVLMHQFCRVGSYVMLQGGSRFSKDIPPYIIAGRDPIAYCGINIVGLRRHDHYNRGKIILHLE